MNLVKQNHINAGNIKVGKTGTKIEWELNEGAFDQIEYVRATCGCTTPKWDSKLITASYNDSTDVNQIKNSPNKAILVTKKLKIYLKDGKLLKIFNTRGIEEFNPDKAHVDISFTVTVSME